MSNAIRTPAHAGEWAGRHLGTATTGYDERDAILYALAVGASPAQLDLVFERDLRVLPPFALTLCQWAPDMMGDVGAFEVGRAVHGHQKLVALKELPRSGEVTMDARVGNVWDKGSAAIFEIEVESDYFLATFGIFAPGSGGFGGDRGPSREARPAGEPAQRLNVEIAANQAALYRLLGDRHHIHIDPEAASGMGLQRPLMHGLCTLVAAVLPIGEAVGAHPADLRTLEGRFTTPAFPGSPLSVRAWDSGQFEVEGPETNVISDGRVTFGP